MVFRREAAMQDGLQRAVGVPLSLAERINVLWPHLKDMVVYGNIACKSDAQVRHIISTCSGETLFIKSADDASHGSQVAAKALEAAVFGAYFNVVINLRDITDAGFTVAVSVSLLC